MLTEPSGARRTDGELERRWFTDEQMDLYLWFDDDGLVRLQLCYDKQRAERVLWWTRGKGHHHDRIDDGQDVPGRARSPILRADGQCNVDELLLKFREASTELADETFDLVYRCLLDFKHRP